MKTLLGKYVPFLPLLALLFFFMQMGSADADNMISGSMGQNIGMQSDHAVKELAAKIEENKEFLE